MLFQFVLLLCTLTWCFAWQDADIYAAVEENDLMKLSLMLSKKGLNVDYAYPRSSWTALILAASKNYKEIVTVLLHRGANPNKAEKDGWSPLLFACAYGHKEVANILVAAGADILQANNNGLFPLASAQDGRQKEILDMLQAALEGRKPKMPPFIQHHLAAKEEKPAAPAKKAEPAPVNKEPAVKKETAGGPTKDLNTIMRAIKEHKDVPALLNMMQEDWVKPLLNKQDASVGGLTPVYLAARLGLMQLVQQLVKQGANVNIAEQDGWTPLMSAAVKGDNKMIEFYLNAGGANALMKNGKGMSACELALAQKHQQAAAYIGSHALNRYIVDTTSHPPADLMVDAKVSTALLGTLLQCGADPNVVGAKDKTSFLMIAAARGYDDVLVMMLRAHADMNLVDGNGWSALMYAAAGGHTNSAVVLLENGHVDPSIKSKQGMTAVQLAAKHRHPAMESLLKEYDARLRQTQEKHQQEQLKQEEQRKLQEQQHAKKQHQTTAAKPSQKAKETAPEVPKKGVQDPKKEVHKTNPQVDVAVVPSDKDVTVAIEKDDATLLEKYIQQKASVTFTDKNGYTPLLKAVSLGKVKCMHLLLAFTANAPLDSRLSLKEATAARTNAIREFSSVQERDGWSALMVAGFQGRMDMVDALLAHHADALAVNNKKVTAYDLAYNNGHKLVAARIATEALHFAIRTENLVLMNQLLAVGANPTTIDIEVSGRNPLMIMVRAGSAEHVDDFLRLHTHVDVNVVDKTGWTAGLFAVERNDVALVSVLVAAGADTAFKNPKGVNMLTLARDKNFNDIVKVLTNFPDATSMKAALLAQKSAKVFGGATASNAQLLEPTVDAAHMKKLKDKEKSMNDKERAKQQQRDLELEQERKKNLELSAKMEKIAAEKRQEYSKVARDRALKEKTTKDRIAAAEKEANKPKGLVANILAMFGM